MTEYDENMELCRVPNKKESLIKVCSYPKESLHCIHVRYGKDAGIYIGMWSYVQYICAINGDDTLGKSDNIDNQCQVHFNSLI